MDKKDKKHKFNPIRIVVNIVLSPIIIWLVSYAYYGDVRSAVLATLYAITFLNVLGLILKFISLLISSVTFSPFKMLKKSIEIVVSIIITGVYWGIYILIYGSDFSL